MNHKRFMVAAALCAILAGCAMWPFSLVACKGAKCDVLVRVESGCRFTFTPDDLHVARENKNAKIHWYLRDSPGTAFTDDGITFKDPGVVGKEFDEQKRLSPTEYTWRNKNTVPGRHRYNVKVTQSGKDCVYDPIIINDP